MNNYRDNKKKEKLGLLGWLIDIQHLKYTFDDIYYTYLYLSWISKISKSIGSRFSIDFFEYANKILLWWWNYHYYYHSSRVSLYTTITVIFFFCFTMTSLWSRHSWIRTNLTLFNMIFIVYCISLIYLKK